MVDFVDKVNSLAKELNALKSDKLIKLGQLNFKLQTHTFSVPPQGTTGMNVVVSSSSNVLPVGDICLDRNEFASASNTSKPFNLGTQIMFMSDSTIKYTVFANNEGGSTANVTLTYCGFNVSTITFS